MLYGLKTDLIKNINEINELSLKADINFPDKLCEFLIDNFELQSSVLFRIINSSSLIVLGKSKNARKNFIKGSIFSVDLSNELNYSSDISINTNTNFDLQISEYVIYECSVYFNIEDNNKSLIRLAKDTPFSQADYEGIKSIIHFCKKLVFQWLSSQGQNKFNNSLNETIFTSIQELRNQTNTIIGFTSILADEYLTSTQIDYTTTIRKNAQSSLLILNDLIELSKYETKSISLNETNINIKSFIQNLFDSFLGKTANTQITFNTLFDNSIPDSLILDEQRIKNILITMLSFSKALTKSGQITIEVKFENNKLSFILKDTSKGLSEDIRTTLFSPFATKNIEELKATNLTGLSLVLLKKSIEELGGNIYVENNSPGGLKYVFSVNVKSENVKTLIEPESLASLPKPVVGSTNKILVIEDDYASSKLLSNYLNKWGYEPTIVNTEEQVINLINKEKFLAIIMDIALPNINGLELLNKIHSNVNTKNTPVIVCSVEAEQQKAFLMGAVEYFQKPINYNFLVEVLTSYKLRKDSNILCVDDDIPTLNLVKQAITTAGFNAIGFNISAEVIDSIKDKEIDLAIVDLDMPYPNGFELIKLLKSNSKYAHLPIIIYTGKDNFQDDLDQIEGLFDELLDKRSVNMEDLAQTINMMVNRLETPLTVKEVIEKKDGVKILFAEDYKHSQIIVTRLLKKSNFENIAVVENGKEAYDLAVNETFDLILMDMQMPIMNGFEAMEKIRKLPNYKDTPIIALTAFAMKGDRERCLDAGATDYIPKPIDSKEFIEKVKYYTNTLK